MEAALITQNQLIHDLKRAGFQTTSKQLEGWCAKPLLLKRSQEPKFSGGKLDGSTVVYSRSEAAQALAIERAGLHHRSLAPRGAILWCGGMEVADDYWRPTFIKVERHLKTIAKVVRRISDAEGGGTIGERAAAYVKINRLLPKVLRRVAEQDRARLFDIVAEFSTGVVSGIGVTAGDETTSEDIFIRAAQLEQSKAPPKLDLGLIKAVPGVLQSIAEAFDDDNPLSDEEICRARGDFGNAIKILICLQETFGPIGGNNILGLWFGSTFIKSMMNFDLFCLGTSLFARLRRSSNELLTSAEIDKLAQRAELIWHLMLSLRSLVNERPELESLFGLSALKRQIGDSDLVAKLLEQAEKTGIPEITLHPWSNWRNLSGAKKMSFGLSVMSIGSPEEIKLAALGKRADVAVNRSCFAGGV